MPARPALDPRQPRRADQRLRPGDDGADVEQEVRRRQRRQRLRHVVPRPGRHGVYPGAFRPRRRRGERHDRPARRGREPQVEVGPARQHEAQRMLQHVPAAHPGLGQGRRRIRHLQRRCCGTRLRRRPRAVPVAAAVRLVLHRRADCGPRRDRLHSQQLPGPPRQCPRPGCRSGEGEVGGGHRRVEFLHAGAAGGAQGARRWRGRGRRRGRDRLPELREPVGRGLPQVRLPGRGPGRVARAGRRHRQGAMAFRAAPPQVCVPVRLLRR
mmetsp:Transcript_25405/g.71724  ORF Transcript_25405/g.71724 Transcript_25405/m.71724 type:complete len:268 (+) Transcript_25405:426-1229(+)